MRVPDVGIAGHYAGLMAAWERYERPLAITEVHIDSTREDQLRWLREAWESAKAARESGVQKVVYSSSAGKSFTVPTISSFTSSPDSSKVVSIMSPDSSTVR